MSWANERTVCPVCNLENQSIEPTYLEGSLEPNFRTRHWHCADCTRGQCAQIGFAHLNILRNAGPVEGQKTAQRYVDLAIETAKRDKHYPDAAKLLIHWPD